MSEPDYTQLMVKKLAGGLTTEEEDWLAQWLAGAPERQAAFREMQRTWALVGEAAKPDLPDVHAEWRRLAARLHLTPEASVRALPRRKFAPAGRLLSRRYGYLAAAAVVLLAIGLAYWQQLFQTAQRVEIATRNAETRQVELADGTVVQLNYASRIRFTAGLPDSIRRVELRGEAFFVVTPESRPFVVVTPNAQVRVLGTEFNVWARRRATRVIVREGRVSLRAAADAGKRVRLVKNQMAVCEDGSGPEPARTVDTDTLLGWRQGRIVFDKTSLVEVIETLEGLYDIEIELRVSEPEALSISGNFEKKPIENVLEAICLTLGLRFEARAGKYVITE